jgi:hypothetical protein
MATVYLAQDLRHDRPIAVKVLHPELAATVGPERFSGCSCPAAEVACAYLITIPVTYSISMPARTPAKAAQGRWRSSAAFQIICLPIW